MGFEGFWWWPLVITYKRMPLHIKALVYFKQNVYFLFLDISISVNWIRKKSLNESLNIKLVRFYLVAFSALIGEVKLESSLLLKMHSENFRLDDLITIQEDPCWAVSRARGFVNVELLANGLFLYDNGPCSFIVFCWNISLLYELITDNAQLKVSTILCSCWTLEEYKATGHEGRGNEIAIDFHIFNRIDNFYYSKLCHIIWNVERPRHIFQFNQIMCKYRVL